MKPSCQRYRSYLKLKNLPLSYRKDLLTLAWLNSGTACELPEGRQDQVVSGLVKAGQLQALTAFTSEPYSGVQMPAQVQLLMLPGLQRLMAEDEGPQRQGFGIDL